MDIASKCAVTVFHVSGASFWGSMFVWLRSKASQVGPSLKALGFRV